MNHNPTAYTPLEAFALFQELNRNFQNGLVIGTFSRVSETLKKTPLIYEQDEFDANRLSPESLQGFALQLLREERKEERRREAEAAAEKNSAGLSPNSRKRKLQSPPLSTFQEALEQTDKLPNLVEKLYIRFRDSLVREIREDERRFEELQRELAEIERGEWDSKLIQGQRTESAKNGFPVNSETIPARTEGQVAPAPTPPPTQTQAQAHTPTPTPTPAPVPIPTAVTNQPKVYDHAKKPEPQHTPQLPQERKPVHPIPSPVPPATQPPGETHHITPENRPQEPSRPISAAPVLQHPQGIQGYGARHGLGTPQLPITDGLQRPEGIPKGRSPAPIQTSQPHTPTATPTPAPALKWEPPYQPPHQPSPQPPHQLSHQPPHQPPHQASHQASHQPSHQPSHQQSHQVPHQPPQQPSHQLPLPPPPQHQALHQTPIPSPRPPYSTGVTRPPTFSQTPTNLPQYPQNYAGGRQTPGYGQPHRTTTQGSAPASPSVLLPPQNAGQIPPSLQSLPLNATPDGAGQQTPHRHSSSIPTASSPGPSPSTQRQSPHPTIHTPVRPPAVLSDTQPATGPANPPVPSTRWPPAPGPAQTPYPPQTPVQAQPEPQQSQPSPTSRSYSSPYNQQAQPAQSASATQRPQIPPLQTPLAIPQSARPPSAPQAQTPTGASHIIRGHGTKWTSTPTPATPRVEDVTSYFDIQSPVFEPISPGPQPAPLPKASPEQNGKKEIRRTIQKPDGTPNRPRGRPPRVSQKITPLAQSEEVSAEPDLLGSNIKNEEATPQALEDIGHAAATDEGAPSGELSRPSQPSNKRKRQDSPPNRAPPTPATHVLWTRSFNKISQSALDQIISHRHANMFAHPVKPKTAPGYFEIVLQPQDLKGIQKAITAGSKAAAAAVATMPDIDPSATNVWLPMSVDLVPPRGIINIAQLERELVHMFANAIMYNPDPYRGFGPSFLRSNRRASLEGDGEDYRGYEVDENGVVKDTRSMFSEVEKLLSDLRNEVERNAPPPTGVPPSASRSSMSMAGGETNTTEDDADEQVGDTSKRRRIRG